MHDYPGRAKISTRNDDSQTGTYGPQVTVKNTNIKQAENYDVELARLAR